jgi:GntR family galactonate operon transcriptional repressor
VIALGSPRRGLHGRIVEELGRRVVGGRWASGSPLPNEDDLVAELGVSRTVVREAIKVLQAKGLVEVRPKTGTRVRTRRAWHLLDPDVVGWLYADLERGDDLGDLRELQEVRSTIEAAAARLAAGRRTNEQLAEIEANERRVEAAWAEPVARREADLDFHGAVVEAAHNSLLSHVNALIRVALEASAGSSDSDTESARRGAALRASVARAIRAGDAEASEAAMRSLVEHDWTQFSDAEERS